jgi:hypothetical protein
MSNARAALGQAVENLLASLPPLLRVREAGTVLRVQDSTIRYLVQCGKLRAINATRVGPH